MVFHIPLQLHSGVLPVLLLSFPTWVHPPTQMSRIRRSVDTPVAVKPQVAESQLQWLNFILAQKSIPQTISTSYGDDEQTGTSIISCQGLFLKDSYSTFIIRSTSVQRLRTARYFRPIDVRIKYSIMYRGTRSIGHFLLRRRRCR